MLRSLTRNDNKQDFIRLRSYFALLKPRIGKTLQLRSQCYCRSINCFFWIRKNRVGVEISLSQSSKSACSLQLWRWVSFSKMLPSLIFIVVSKSRNKFYIIALLWRAKFSRAPIKEVTRWWGSELDRKIGSLTRFEGVGTKMGICFPIRFVASVSLKLSSCTQIDSKSNIAKFLKSVFSLVYWIPKEVQLVKQCFFRLIYGSSDRHFHLFTACS